MNELPKEAQDLLAGAHTRHSASAAQLEQGLSRLHGRLEFADVGAGVGAAREGAASAGSTGSALNGWFASKFVKLTLSALALGGAVGLGFIARTSPAPAPVATAVSAAQPASAAPAGPSARAEVRAQAPQLAHALPDVAPAAAPDEALAPTEQAATQEAPRTERRRGSARADSRKSVRDPHARVAATSPAEPLAKSAAREDHRASADTLSDSEQDESALSRERAESADTRPSDSERSDTRAEVTTAAERRPEATSGAELALLDDAMQRLRSHDALGALTRLDEHAKRYPRGQLGLERRGLRVLALCAAGKLDEGRSEQSAFLASASSAPIAARVRRACGRSEER